MKTDINARINSMLTECATSHEDGDNTMDALPVMSLLLEVQAHIRELEASALTWTKEKPTKAGWYWYKSQSGLSVTLCDVYLAPFGFLAHLHDSPRATSVSELHGEFAGPMSPPNPMKGE